MQIQKEIGKEKLLRGNLSSRKYVNLSTNIWSWMPEYTQRILNLKLHLKKNNYDKKGYKKKFMLKKMYEIGLEYFPEYLKVTRSIQSLRQKQWNKTGW